jgi:2-polyprenyl-3-methyl-5-hydroxy-6-metoxy-1,4-benzoquinol methylase
MIAYIELFYNFCYTHTVAGVVQWQNNRFPICIRGSDSLHPLSLAISSMLLAFRNKKLIMQTTNLEKHTTENPVSQFFLNNFNQLLLEQVKKIKPDSILDVGAGEGFTLEIFRKNKIAKKLEGIEYMDEALKLAKRLHPKVMIKKGDIYNLPYKANSFDLIICTEVLEHLEDPKKALEELRRVTKKYLILSVPNEPLFTVQRVLRGKNVLKLGAHPEHIQHWSSGAFEKFVKSKCTIKDIKTPLPWTMVTAKK